MTINNAFVTIKVPISLKQNNNTTELLFLYVHYFSTKYIERKLKHNTTYQQNALKTMKKYNLYG